MRDTIRLKPDTVLIGLPSGLTQLDLPDSTSGYDGVGPAKPVLEAPPGGSDIESGIGHLYRRQPIRAPARSSGRRARIRCWTMVQIFASIDIYLPQAVRTAFYDTERRPDSPYNGRWGAQYPSIWVRGGGGSFADIWTADTFARGGFLRYRHQNSRPCL